MNERQSCIWWILGPLIIMSIPLALVSLLFVIVGVHDGDPYYVGAGLFWLIVISITIWGSRRLRQPKKRLATQQIRRVIGVVAFAVNTLTGAFLAISLVALRVPRAM
jgi:hypothetical protein